MSDVGFVEHDDRVDAGVASHHGVSFLEVLQKGVFIPEQELPGASGLCKTSETHFYRNKLDKVFEQCHIFPVVQLFEFDSIILDHQFHHHRRRKQFVKRQ